MVQRCLLLAVRGGRFELSRRHQLVFQSLRGDRQGRTLGRSLVFSYGFVFLVAARSDRFCTGFPGPIRLLLNLLSVAFLHFYDVVGAESTKLFRSGAAVSSVSPPPKQYYKCCSFDPAGAKHWNRSHRCGIIFISDNVWEL